MAFALPTFNLTCNIETCPVPNVPSVPTGPYRITGAVCNLAWGRRVNMASVSSVINLAPPTLCMTLLLSARQDVRGPQDTVSKDMLEVPAGSGRWYSVEGVDDVGKGFMNEHRAAVLLALPGGWTAPYP
jgi:hypothetical protein